MKKLLITAFEPFGGELINPSLEAVRIIEGIHLPGVRVEVLKLPVSRFEAVDVTLARMRGVQPDVVLMLGEAGGRAQVMPERVAVNWDDFPIPDESGNQPRGERIVENGAEEFHSTLPVEAIVSQLNDAEILAGVSHSAGRFLCNRLFYSVMQSLSESNASTIAGFMHLPYLPEQTANKTPGCPSLSREAQVQAVRIAMEASLEMKVS